MLKFVVIGALVLGAVFGIPSLRAKLSPVIDPIVNKLGPVGGKVSEPGKRWAAKNEANVFLRRLTEDYAQGRKLPSPTSFITWVKTNTKAGKKGLDPWGSPYYFNHPQHLLVVGSRGPDKIRNTPDDIQVSAPIN